MPLKMTRDPSIENLFKQTSIRGRLAFGTKCIEHYIIENDIQNIWLDRLMETLWEFTTSNRLDEWEEKIGDLEPFNILDDHPDNKASDYNSLSESDFYELRELYKKWPSYFIDMIDLTIQIGTGNLYGGTGEYSKCTLEPTMQVYDIAKRILKTMPDIVIFSISKFSENHGWGNNIEREMFDN